MSELILLERDGAVARVTLNRPETGNAIDPAFSECLLDIANQCEADPAVRSVLLTGAGRFFCVGGDVHTFSSARADLGRFVRGLTASLHMAIARLAALTKPVITAVNGPAAGAGVGLALVGDVVFAAEHANFTLAYPNIGLSPDAGTTFLLPRLIGLRRTQSMAFLGEALSAEDAVNLGLITRCIPKAKLVEEAEATAQRIAAMPTKALARTKQLLLRGATRSLEEQLEQEAMLVALSGTEPNATEGIDAFLQRRRPTFQ